MIPKACVVCGQPAGNKSRCPRHDPKRGNQGRPWYRGEYPRLRRELWKDGPPICVECRQRPATQLHHVAPRSGQAGFKPLCDECHREQDAWDPREAP